MVSNLLLAALPLLVAYLVTKLRYLRFKQFSEIPQHKPSFLWGHLKVVHEFTQRCTAAKKDLHSDFVFQEMNKKLGNPGLMLVDLRPVAYPIAVITSHHIAEQISRASKLFPWSTPKSPTINAFDRLIGSRSIISRQGEEWKHLRKRFNPGFAPHHLMTLLPCILDKTQPFIEHLDGYAKTGDEFLLDDLTVNLTFDIIGAVVMDVDFDAQHPDTTRQGEFIRLLSEQVHTYGSHNGPWWLRPRVEWRRYQIDSRLNQILWDMIRQKHAEQQQQQQQQQQQGASQKSRSVLGLSLQGVDHLSDALIKDTGDQIRSFLFAGHDTTAILLGWIFYELSRTPAALKAVRDELDDIFGRDADPDVVREKLLSREGEDAIRHMTYTSAVIKEALRLHPPAGTARRAPPGSGFMVRTPQGEDLCLDGLVVYNCANIIQRDPAVFGDTADDFVPERWLGDADTPMKPNGEAQGEGEGEGGRRAAIPASAWRPFERGPRNCIGQELANIEARVIIAVVARRYDFVKVGRGEIRLDGNGKPTLNEKGQFEVESELYSVSCPTSMVNALRYCGHGSADRCADATNNIKVD
ncbi:cytochrome P450 [Lasiosphaeria ovina]|uniref:Cytochrome P450 n=1 Tax=Lasiosphaeria ovina TaxID=92902 RepID=A0AAE0N714_9PEZI|nr:cytochrome P450 [Lasiosphaeria ovina]